LPGDNGKEAEGLLRRLAGAAAPAAIPGDGPAARAQYRAAWLAWWKDHAASVDLAQLQAAPTVTGLIVVAELGPKGAKGGKFGPGGFPGGGFDPKDVGGKGGGFQAKAPKGKKGGALPVQPKAVIPAKGTDRLVALDRDGHSVWQIEDLDHPIDFQVLPGDRVVIAEYYARRVTERDLTGKILWEVSNLPNSPMNVQRLANGNTFIALYGTAAA